MRRNPYVESTVERIFQVPMEHGCFAFRLAAPFGYRNVVPFGVKDGAPQVCIVDETGVAHFILVLPPKTQMTPAQEAWRDAALETECRYTTARTICDAIVDMKSWGLTRG